MIDHMLTDADALLRAAAPASVPFDLHEPLFGARTFDRTFPRIVDWDEEEDEGEEDEEAAEGDDEALDDEDELFDDEDEEFDDEDDDIFDDDEEDIDLDDDEVE